MEKENLDMTIEHYEESKGKEKMTEEDCKNKQSEKETNFL